MMLDDDESRRGCSSYLRHLVQDELAKAEPDVVLVSTCLGALEDHLTSKAEQSWPKTLPAIVAAAKQTFAEFVTTVAEKLSQQSSSSPREKVKFVADQVWSYLTGVFTKDAQHVQILQAPKGRSRRHLDCAGVVTTTLAACKCLSEFGEHADLQNCQLQVSEDHCWINLNTNGSREGTVEVTTDTAARRGHVVGEEAWKGWLYTGGHAVLCSPKMALTALIASLNPSIIHRQTTGTDSEELQDLQYNLLEFIYEEHEDAVYPAALCTLADLKEIRSQDELQKALQGEQKEQILTLLEHSKDSPQTLFEEAIAISLRERLGSGRCWYPYSYLIGYLARRGRFILKDALPLLGVEQARRLGDPLLHLALETCGSQKAASVLRQYRFQPVDEELHKDLEGILEIVWEILKYFSKRDDSNGSLCNPRLLVAVLELWDGICWCWSGNPKPGGWISLLLRIAKLFSEEARKSAAALSEVSSQAMLQARDMWTSLKPQQLRPLFEVADVETEAGRTIKKARRHE